MNINKIQSNQNKPAFTSLNINEKAIRAAGTKIFNGVRQTLMPEEGQLSSKIQRLSAGAYCDVYIGSREPEKGILNLGVRRGQTTMCVDEFETKDYNSDVELGAAIIKKIEDTYKEIGSATQQHYF